MKRISKQLCALLLAGSAFLSALPMAAAEDGHEHGAEPQPAARTALPDEVSPCYLRYDLNSDGAFDAADVFVLHDTLQDKNADLGALAGDENWDVLGNGTVTDADAAALLQKLIWPGQHYVAAGDDGRIVHVCADSWTWRQSSGNWTASVSLQCSCGAVIQSAVNAAVTKEEIPGTCMAAGEVCYTAKATLNGVEYTDTRVTERTAFGEHSFSGSAADPCPERTCTLCGAAREHDYSDWTVTRAADCTQQGERTRSCTVCGSVNTETTAALGHHYVDGGVIRNVEGCTFAHVLECDRPGCGAQIDGDTFVEHANEVAVTQHATCSTTGSKTLTCSVCGGSVTEEIAINPDAHTWAEDTPGSGCYRCSACNATKTTLAAQDGAVLDHDALSVGTEILLANDVSVTIKDAGAAGTLGQMSGLSIFIIEAPQSEKEQLAQSETTYGDAIGEGRVYQISIQDNGEAFSQLGGNVTVSIPYTLAPGENPDNIVVLYIADDGTVSEVTGRYTVVDGAGYVTFTTNHFSNYVITALSPSEYCALNGHSGMVQFAPSCEGTGYTYCTFCGQHIGEDTPALGHSYIAGNTNDCETGVTYTCQRQGCDASYTVGAAQHSWIADEAHSTPATCTETGTAAYLCEVCGAQKTTVASALGHDYGTPQDVPASCSTRGKTVETCAACGDQVITYTAPAAGHTLTDAWEWQQTSGEPKAAITLSCSACGKTVVAAQASVSSSATPVTDCTQGGTVTYTACYSYNLQLYSAEPYTKTVAGTMHRYGSWTSLGEEQHHRTCAKCGIVQAEAHSFDANRVCTVCGYQAPACKHSRTNMSWIDLNNTPCNSRLQVKTCASCGEILEMYLVGDCMPEWINGTGGIDNGYYVYTQVSQCPNCGLVVTGETSYTDVDASACTAKQIYVQSYSYGGNTYAYTQVNHDRNEHPVIVITETHDLHAQLGACEGTVEYIISCPCDRYINATALGGCQWSYDDSDDYIHHSHAVCGVCGLQEDMQATDQKDNTCYGTRAVSATYTKGGRHLTLNWTEKGYFHNNSVTYELATPGTKCTDGVYEKSVCSDCGARETVLRNDRHYTVRWQTIDISGYRICANTMYLSTCACGQNICGFNTMCRYADPTDWHIVEDNGTTRTEAYLQVCRQCGSRKEAEQFIAKTGNGCTTDITETARYYAADGTFIAEGEQYFNGADHTFSAIFELLPGSTTCLDGVRSVETCSVCGNTSSYEIRRPGSHCSYLVQEYGLAGYGMCVGTLKKYACPCGAISSVTQDMTCQFQYVSGDSVSGLSTYRCSKCGATRTWQSTEVKHDGECKADQTWTENYYAPNGNLITSATGVQVIDSHNYQNVYTLINPDNCLDGYRITRCCSDCGKIVSTSENPVGLFHPMTVTVSEINLADYGFCGGHVKTIGCPCGEISQFFVTDEECKWQTLTHDPDVPTSATYICTECGGKKTELLSIPSNSSAGCAVFAERTVDYYSPGGDSLLAMNMMSHEYLASDFVLNNGVDCEGGYHFSMRCRNCGKYIESEVDEDRETEHHRYYCEYDYVGGTENFPDGTYRLSLYCACDLGITRYWIYPWQMQQNQPD